MGGVFFFSSHPHPPPPTPQLPTHLDAGEGVPLAPPEQVLAVPAHHPGVAVVHRRRGGRGGRGRGRRRRLGEEHDDDDEDSSSFASAYLLPSQSAHMSPTKEKNEIFFNCNLSFFFYNFSHGVHKLHSRPNFLLIDFLSRPPQ